MSPLPDNKVIESLQMLIWSSVVGDVSLMNQPIKIHEEFDKVSYMCIHVQYMCVCIFILFFIFIEVCVGSS